LTKINFKQTRGNSSEIELDIPKNFQTEIDFGEEFSIKTQTISAIKYAVDVCHICGNERELTDMLPMGLDGWNYVADPYSDLISSNICQCCYEESEGDEIWRLYNRRHLILNELLESRFLSTRSVIVEKIKSN
jgi:hypothetical protein